MEYTLNQLMHLYTIVKTEEEKESILVVILSDLRADGMTDEEIVKFLSPSKHKPYIKYLRSILNQIGYCDNCVSNLN